MAISLASPSFMATFEGDFVDPQPFPPSLVQADSTDESDNNAPKKSKSKSKKSKKEKKRKVLKPIEVHSEVRQIDPKPNTQPTHTNEHPIYRAGTALITARVATNSRNRSARRTAAIATTPQRLPSQISTILENALVPARPFCIGSELSRRRGWT